MNNNNILFYSKTCQTSVNLINILNNEGILPMFKMICVDGQVNKFQNTIRTVPTMIVSNVKKPLEGKETFEWVEKFKFIRKQVYSNSIVNNNIAQKNQHVGPLEYKPLEMGSISDKFAYKDHDLAMPQSFVQASQLDNKIFTAPEQEKLTKDQQTKKIKHAEEKRKEQDKTILDTMKKQHLEAIYKNEKDHI